MFWRRVCITPLKSRFQRAHIDLARRGAWSAAIRHAPRVLGGAVGIKGRAQLIKETFYGGDLDFSPLREGKATRYQPKMKNLPNHRPSSHSFSRYARSFGGFQQQQQQQQQQQHAPTGSYSSVSSWLMGAVV